MNEENGRAAVDRPPYIECPGCHGNGFLKGPLDEATGVRELRDHDRCNGSGILVLRPNGLYRGPKLH